MGEKGRSVRGPRNQAGEEPSDGQGVGDRVAALVTARITRDMMSSEWAWGQQVEGMRLIGSPGAINRWRFEAR